MIRVTLTFVTIVCLTVLVWLFSSFYTEDVLPFGKDPVKALVLPAALKKYAVGHGYCETKEMIAAYSSQAKKGDISPSFPLEKGKLQLFTHLSESRVDVYLLNASDSLVKVLLQDGCIMMLREAQNEKGEWKPIEYWWTSWCGNSYDYAEIKPMEGIMCSTFFYKGSVKTLSRFKVKIGKKIFYSSSYPSMVNPGQFGEKKYSDQSFFEEK